MRGRDVAGIYKLATNRIQAVILLINVDQPNCTGHNFGRSLQALAFTR